MVQRQSKGAVRLAGIVDDLLRFARLANAEFNRVPFDLTKAARRAASEAAGRGWAHAPTIEVKEGMYAEGDPNLVGYALTNLLDNACKFSPEGGTVAVGEKNGAYFVRDQGVGFDMAYAGKLFVAFERLVDQKTFQGTGLGLQTCGASSSGTAEGSGRRASRARARPSGSRWGRGSRRRRLCP